MSHENPVKVAVEKSLMMIRLNRPKAINSLNTEMIGLIRKALEQAETEGEIRLVLLMGEGEKGFCAGADVKAVVRSLDEDRKDEAMRFFTEEYALDLAIHRFPKPIVAIANGITMGGGLGLTAGADLVIVCENTRMAMPETRIGFFPDVGATGWLFEKCPKGYAEYLALTGYEAEGSECVRLGLAHACVSSGDIPNLITSLRKQAGFLTGTRNQSVHQLLEKPDALVQEKRLYPSGDEDLWIKQHFHGRTSITDILTDLTRDKTRPEKCKAILNLLSERSPTAAVLTLQLLRNNEGLPLEMVFAAETKATRFIISHPDYREGVRARLLDKDNLPKWQPDSFEKVTLPSIETLV